MSILALSSVAYEFLKKLVYGKTGLVVAIAALVFFLVGWNAAGIGSKVSGWFGGKDIPTLKAEVALKDETIERLTHANKDKDVQIGMVGEVHQHQIDTIVEVVQKDKVVDNVVTKAKAKKKDKVQTIALSTLSEEQKVVQESIVIVEALWEVHCSVEPNCKKEIES